MTEKPCHYKYSCGHEVCMMTDCPDYKPKKRGEPYFGTTPQLEELCDWLQQPAEKEGKKCDRFFIDDGGQCSADSCWDVDRRDYRIGVKCGGDKTKCCLSDRCT